MLPNDRLVVGNAYDDGAPRRGWFIAAFLDPALGLRCRADRGTTREDTPGDFEMKLFRHPAGDREARRFPFNKTATTVSLLVGTGRFEIDFCDGPQWQTVVLERDGDYAVWAPGVGHRWFAARASSVLTVRSPAVDAGDQEETPEGRTPGELLRRPPGTR